MARLRHPVTGVVVDVSDDKATRLPGFTSADDAAEKPKATRRTSTAKASADEDK